MRPHLYLASASPRRHELLLQIGVAHRVLTVPAPPGEDEPRLLGESPLDYVQRTARDKAQRAQAWLNIQDPLLHDHTLPILTADTTVAIGECVLGKPQDEQDAERILNMMSNREHLVHTALVLSTAQQQRFALSTSVVTFHTLTQEDIRQYIETGEPFGKAGAYGIQGYAAQFIKKIEGSYSGIMGLPLFETAQILKNR